MGRSQSQIHILGYLVNCGRMLAFCCVPLFIIITGYLCGGKILSPRYYIKGVRILIEYCLCALLIYGAKAVLLSEPVSLALLVRTVAKISDYWYVKMILQPWYEKLGLMDFYSRFPRLFYTVPVTILVTGLLALVTSWVTHKLYSFIPKK